MVDRIIGTPTPPEVRARRTALALGLHNGLLTGLALAVGTWLLHAILLSGVPLRMANPPVIVGALVLVLLGGIAGWLAAWLHSMPAGALIWGIAGVLMALVINHVPYEGHNLLVWLSDRRFWGLPILPFDEPAQVRLWLSGFFVVVILTILGLFQDYRLESLAREVDAERRMSGRTWMVLVLPLPLVLAAGVIADNIVNSPLRTGPRLVHEAIQTGRTYQGDLFQLSLQRGFNYTAIAPVREQMSPHYVLSIGEADLGAVETLWVVGHFDNGTWINCMVVRNTLSACYNASRPYLEGFPALLNTGELPEDCPACKFRISEELHDWVLERRGNFQSAPRITRLGQWGTYVLMRAETADPAGYALECRFHGLTPIYMEECWELVGPTASAGAGEAPSSP